MYVTTIFLNRFCTLFAICYTACNQFKRAFNVWVSFAVLWRPLSTNESHILNQSALYAILILFALLYVYIFQKTSSRGNKYIDSTMIIINRIGSNFSFNFCERINAIDAIEHWTRCSVHDAEQSIDVFKCEHRYVTDELEITLTSKTNEWKIRN